MLQETLKLDIKKKLLSYTYNDIKICFPGDY